MEKLITNNNEFMLDLRDFTDFFQQLHRRILEEKLNVTPGNINIEYLEYLSEYKEEEQLKLSNQSFKKLVKTINISDTVKKDLDDTLKLIQDWMLENLDKDLYEKDDNTDYLELFKGINILRSISNKDESVTFEDLIHCHYIRNNPLFKSIIKTPNKKEVTKRI